MDCEKFDSHVIDALYDELDEVTTAALKRHVEGCSRCAGVWSGLRATREVGLLPIEEPSDDLEDRILTAAARVEVRTPWSRRVLRGLAWAGSHAMRPQLAMAALFFLVIGSSLLLLRARPGSHAGIPVRVTERGAPAAEAEAPEARRSRDQLADSTPAEAAAATAAPAATAPAPTSVAFAAPGAQDQSGELAKQSADKDAPSASAGDGIAGNQDLARKALASARATRDQSGCSAALSGFDQVGSKFPGTSAAADAMMDAASCYKSMGDVAKARELLLTLRGSDGYRDRANSELNDLAQGQSNSNNVGNAQGVAAAVPRAASPAPAAPPPSPAAKPKGANEDAESTSGKKAVSAPAKKAPAPAQTDHKAAESL